MRQRLREFETNCQSMMKKIEEFRKSVSIQTYKLLDEDKAILLNKKELTTDIIDGAKGGQMELLDYTQSTLYCKFSGFCSFIAF